MSWNKMKSSFQSVSNSPSMLLRDSTKRNKIEEFDKDMRQQFEKEGIKTTLSTQKMQHVQIDPMMERLEQWKKNKDSSRDHSNSSRRNAIHQKDKPFESTLRSYCNNNNINSVNRNQNSNCDNRSEVSFNSRISYNRSINNAIHSQYLRSPLRSLNQSISQFKDSNNEVIDSVEDHIEQLYQDVVVIKELTKQNGMFNNLVEGKQNDRQQLRKDIVEILQICGIQIVKGLMINGVEQIKYNQQLWYVFLISFDFKQVWKDNAIKFLRENQIMQEDCLQYIEKRITMIKENHGQVCQQAECLNDQIEIDQREKEGQLIRQGSQDGKEMVIEKEKKIEEYSKESDQIGGKGVESEENVEERMNQGKYIEEQIHQDFLEKDDDKGEVNEERDQNGQIEREDSQNNHRTHQEIIRINNEEDIKKQGNQEEGIVNDRVDFESNVAQASQYSEKDGSKQADDIGIIEQINSTEKSNGNMSEEDAREQALEMINTSKDNIKMDQLESVNKQQQPSLQGKPLFQQFEWLSAEVADSQNKFKRMQLPAVSPQFFCQGQDNHLEKLIYEQDIQDSELRSITRRLDYNLSEAQRQCLKSVREDNSFEEVNDNQNLDREIGKKEDILSEKSSKKELGSQDQQVFLGISQQLLGECKQNDKLERQADRRLKDCNSLVEDEQNKTEESDRNCRSKINKYSFGNVSSLPTDYEGQEEQQIEQKNNINSEEYVEVIQKEQENISKQEIKNQEDDEQNNQKQIEENEREKKEEEEEQKVYDTYEGDYENNQGLNEEKKNNSGQVDQINETSQGNELDDQDDNKQQDNSDTQGIQHVDCYDISQNLDTKEINNNILEINNNNYKNENETEAPIENNIEGIQAQNIAAFLQNYQAKTRDEILQDILAAEEVNSHCWSVAGDADLQANNKRISKDMNDGKQQTVEQNFVEGIHCKEENDGLIENGNQEGESLGILRDEKNNQENEDKYGFSFNFMDNPMMKYQKQSNSVIENNTSGDGYSQVQQNNTEEDTSQFNNKITETNLEDANNTQNAWENQEDENNLTNQVRNSVEQDQINNNQDNQLQDEQKDKKQQEGSHEKSNSNSKSIPQEVYSSMNQEYSDEPSVPLSSHNTPSAQKSHQKPKRKSKILGLDISDIESQDLENSGSQYVLTNITYSAHKKHHIHEKEQSNNQTPVKSAGYFSENKRQSYANLQASPYVERADNEQLLSPYEQNELHESQQNNMNSDGVFPHWTRRSIRISNKHKKLSLKDEKQNDGDNDERSNISNLVDYNDNLQEQFHQHQHGDTEINQFSSSPSNKQEKKEKSSKLSPQSHEYKNPFKYLHAQIDVSQPTQQQ